MTVDASGAEADLLAQLGVELAEAGRVNDMLVRLADAAREVTHARYAAIGVVGPDGQISDFFTSGLDEDARRRIGDPPRGLGLLGAIRSSAGPIRIADIGADPRATGFPEGHPSMTSFLGTPIRVRERHFGNIYVTDSDEGEFTPRDERLIQALAAFAAVAIRGGELRDERQRWIDGLEGVCGIAATLSRPGQDLGELLPEAARRSRALLNCDTVGVALGAETGLRVPYAFGPRALRLEAIGAFASAGELQGRLTPHSCHVAPFGEGDAAGAIVVVADGEVGHWREEVADILAQHVGGAVVAAQTVSDVKRDLREESDARTAALAAELERRSQQRAVMAQEGERARIARELHDETGQLLTGISLRLKGLGQRLGDSALEGEIDDLRGHVRGVQDAIRRFLRELRPVDLDEGLASAVSDLVTEASSESSCHFKASCDPLPPLPEEVEVALYRIAQEGITNVLRHSDADHATVTLSSTGTSLRLSIEDDGRGFLEGADTAGHGLTGIRERVELIGGGVRISSTPGAGTAVVVDLGLAQDPPAP